MKKISIIGAGNLGATIAYEIAGRGIADEIILIDILNDLAFGQAADIQQCLPYKNRTSVQSGEYKDMIDSNIVIVTAGKPRTPEMNDRLQLAEINTKIIHSIAKEIKKFCKDAIIITITNPMDIMNHFLYNYGFEKKKVIGSGGQLDSSRLRVVLGHPKKNVEAYILGEHGEGQIPIFSKIVIDDEKITYTEEEKKEIIQKVRQSALEVISKKGATVFAPASNTADMVEAILNDYQKLMICSTNVNGEYGLENVSLGVPVVLGKDGIERIEEWNLDEIEIKEMQSVAKKLQLFYEEATKHIKVKEKIP